MDCHRAAVRGIEMDTNGYLWIATEFGLVRYDGVHFKVYNQADLPDLKENRVIRIGLLQDKRVFIECAENKFYQVRNDETIVHFHPDQKEKKLIDMSSGYKGPDLYYRCVSLVKNKIAPDWVLPEKPGQTPSSLNALRIVNDNFYYLNKNNDLISADSSWNHFNKWQINGPLASELKLAKRGSGAISLLPHGDKLFLRSGRWLYALTFDRKTNVVSSTKFLNIGDISFIPFFRAYPHQNLYLIGTMNDGLFVFRKNSFSSLKFKNPEINVFYSLAPYGQNGVFTNNGVLYPGQSSIINRNGITTESLLKATSGEYYANRWISKDESGIVILDDKLKEVNYIRENDLRVRCFRELSDGKVWFSAEKHFLGKIENNKLIYINRPAKLPQDFIISCFIETPAKSLWIAGVAGLAQIDTSGKLLKVISELKNINVRCLYMDKKGVLWIGSYNRGFYAYYNNRLVTFPLDKNKYLASAHSFLEDQNGYVWISTNQGLFQANLTDLYRYIERPAFQPYYLYHEQSEGFLTNEFNGGCTPSGIILSNGAFLFPSMKSIVHFYPDSITPLLPTSPIFIDAIVADTSHISLTEPTPNISRQVNRLKFFISSPYFGNQYNQYVDYQLNGLDTTWYPLNDNGIVEFNELSSGKYELTLRKKNGFGEANVIFTKKAFIVLPFFHETWSFRGFAIFIALLLSYLLYKTRVHYLLEQKKALEDEVRIRTNEQELLIEHLETAITELEVSKEHLHQNTLFKEKLAMVIMHDLQSPLRFLFAATRKAYENSFLTAQPELASTNLELMETTGKIYHFVNDFGWWLSTMGTRFKVQKERIDLKELLVELNYFFTEQLKATGNELTIQNGDIQFIKSDRRLLKIILRNIIDNANKNTRNGHISIETFARNGNCSLKIKDNGDGIHKTVLAKLKLRLKEKNTNYSENETGFGFRFIIDLSKQLEINVDITSDRGSGTIIELSNFNSIE